MALVVADRVKETSTTAGTGTLTLLGAVSGYQSFSVIGSGNTTYYCIVDDNTGQWEVGVGTYTSPNQLSRDSVLSSSSGGSAITFLGNIKQVFVTYPAGRSVYSNAAGSLVLTKVEATTGIVTNLTSTSAVLTNVTATSATVTNVTFTSVTLTNLTATSASITNATAASLTVSTGNLTFSSTAQRITGDMSNATITNRLMVQTSTTNGNTLFSVMPNGTGTAALVRAFNSSTPAQFVDIRIDGTEAQLRSSYEGTSTFLPLTFYTGGSERMRLDTSGNLGIGTASPVAKTQIAVAAQTTVGNSVGMWIGDSTGGAGNVHQIGFGYTGGSVTKPAAIIGGINENNGGNTTEGIFFATRTAITDTAPTERMRIDSSGNVGIGTTSPTSLGSGYQSITTNGTNGSGFVIKINGTDASYIYQNSTALQLVNTQATPIYFFTSNTERLRIDSSGNVGIGTATPDGKVEIKENSSAAVSNLLVLANSVASSAGTGADLRFYVNDGREARYAAVRSVQATSGNFADLRFLTSNSDTPAVRMTIDPSGNVGIGGTAQAYSRLNLLGTYPTSSNATQVVRLDGTIPSGTTASYRSFLSRPVTQATAFTLTNLIHFEADTQTLGAGSAVTNQYGFSVADSLTGATNNYGFYSNIASGTNRWNFYANGTAANYFAGTVQNGSTISVGAATPAASGAGVTFPATQSASSDANTLDDYEEGTWTPTLKNASSSSTFTSNTGRYTKIGRLVYCSFVNDSGNTGTAGSDITLSGLPFAFGGTSNVPTLVSFTGNGIPAAVNYYSSRTANGSTSFVVRDAGGNALTNQLTFAAGTIIYEV